MNRTFWFCASIALVLVVGCAKPSAQPTVKSATDLLNQAVDAALAGDFQAVCSRASSTSMCRDELMSGLQARVPKARPNILCSYVLPDRRVGTEILRGGQVLVLEGVDGQNRSFITDFLVFHDGESLVATNIIWWSNMRLGRAHEDGRASTARQGGEPLRCGP